MIHPDTELRHVNEQIGYGVFATRDIPKGTVTWVRDPLDQTLSPAQVEAMPHIYRVILEKYTYTDAKGMYVLCWDHARFFNHSCDANCLSAGYDFEIAVRDIAAGEELTDDYGSLNLKEGFRCACASPECRRWILPDDMERLSARWDSAVREVFPRIATVPQPLWAYLREKAEVEAALAMPEMLRSIRSHYARALQVAGS